MQGPLTEDLAMISRRSSDKDLYKIMQGPAGFHSTPKSSCIDGTSKAAQAEALAGTIGPNTNLPTGQATGDLTRISNTKFTESRCCFLKTWSLGWQSGVETFVCFLKLLPCAGRFWSMKTPDHSAALPLGVSF